MDQDPSAFSRDVRTERKRMNEWKTGACEMQQVRPATRPAAAISRPRSSPFPPPWQPSIKHGGERTMWSPFLTTTTLHPTLRALPRNTRFSSPPQTFLASPAANPSNSRARWSNMRLPLSAPLGEVEASPRVPRHHSRPTHPPATRAHRFPGPPV